MDEDRGIERAQIALDNGGDVVVLTGSGVSVESDIPTFRGGNGGTMAALWSDFDPRTLATPEAFDADPELVTRWYDWRRLMCLRAEPNPGHRALATLQNRVEAAGRRFTLLTQNVDGLHQRAGSTGVIELHGSIMRWRGVRSGTPAVLPEGPFDSYPPTLESGELIRPSVVWFGEALPEDAVRAAGEALRSCGVFLSIGTSSVVYPAAGFIDDARRAGAVTIEVNPASTAISGDVDICLRGPAGEVLPLLMGGG